MRARSAGGKPSVPKKAPVAAKGATGRRASHHHRKSTESAKTRHQAALKAAKTRHRRKLSLGEVACCPAEAVAMAARLAGWAVTGADVLDLYARCADGPSSGFTIAAALTAGIGGKRLAFGPVDSLDEIALPPGEHRQFAAQRHLIGEPDHVFSGHGHALILGVDLPGPHAVTVAPDGTWWSWGEPFDPEGWPGMVIEEAWEVTFR